MVDKDTIRSKVSEDATIKQTGRWYIAEGSYDGRERVAQGESYNGAVEALVARIYTEVRDHENAEKERERRKELREKRNQRADRRAEKAVKEAQRHEQDVKELFGS